MMKPGCPGCMTPNLGVMITYDDPELLALKADYLKEHWLGGVMIWELSQDGGELLSALYNHLYP